MLRTNPPLSDLPDVERIVDTRGAQERDFGNAAAVDEGGEVVAWHVTDEPDSIIALLKREINFVKAHGQGGHGAELGPGLYVSAVPAFWSARSRSKWDFLYGIDEESVEALGQALLRELSVMQQMRYITDWEEARASSLVERAISAGSPNLLTQLAGQPYNISFWTKEWLAEKAGLEVEQRPPVAVKVRLSGAYAELKRSRPPFNTLRALRRADIAGVFMPGGFVETPQLAVFHGRFARFLAVEEV